MSRFRAIATVLIITNGAVAQNAGQEFVPAAPSNVSFKQEIQHSIDRGLEWLRKNQNTNGYWASADTPAVTALALVAFKGDPAERWKSNEPEWMHRGYRYILSCARPDGGIHKSNLVTYNTSISMLALLAADKPEYEPVLRKGRRFLVGLQTDLGEKGKIDDVFDGGVGYGSKYQHSDIANTLQALEALSLSKYLVKKDSPTPDPDLNWEAAIHFLQNCQNLPAYNKEPWVSDDPKDKGGFVYYPGQSMAGAVTNKLTGKVALRSYGSISYAGLLSYIYAQLDRDDPRVKAVFEWLQKNYTLEENPGMGPQGLFYYFHTMSKALTVYGVDELKLANGKPVDWRKEVAMRILNLQQRDGSWANENARWREKEPELVTSYAVLTLETIYRGM